MSDLDLPLAVRMMQDGYLMEIQDLKEKNEQLRKERDMYRDLVGMMDHPDLNVQLSAENAKLRELVRDLWSCAASLAEDSVYHIEGEVCGCGTSCVVNGEDCSAYKLRDRARELGVEV